MGCDLAQGYLIARPMPLADLEKLLRRGDPGGAPPRLAESRA
jgi:EAL domain-containing protein (putative c-di-GMP-specific phosphodiesterase class I)